MKKLDDAANKIFGLFIRIASVFLVVMMLFVFVNIILRMVFNMPIRGSTEIVRYTALIGGAFALCQNEWFDGNIRVTILLDALPPKAANAISLIGYGFISAGMIVIVYYLIEQTGKYINSKMLTSELSLPMYIFSAILAFGFAVLSVCFIIKTVLAGYRLFSKDADPGLGIHKAPLE